MAESVNPMNSAVKNSSSEVQWSKNSNTSNVLNAKKHKQRQESKDDCEAKNKEEESGGDTIPAGCQTSAGSLKNTPNLTGEEDIIAILKQKNINKVEEVRALKKEVEHLKKEVEHLKEIEKQASSTPRNWLESTWQQTEYIPYKNQLERNKLKIEKLEAEVSKEQIKVKNQEHEFRKKDDTLKELEEEMLSLKEILAKKNKDVDDKDEIIKSHAKQQVWIMKKDEKIAAYEVSGRKVETVNIKKTAESGEQKQHKTELEKLDKNKAVLQDHMKEISELKDKMSDFQAELSTSKQKEKELQTEMTSKSQSIANMQKELDGTKAELEATIKESGTLKVKVSDLQEELSTSNEKEEALVTKISSICKGIANMQKELETQKAELKAKIKEIGMLKVKVSDLQAEQSTSNEKEKELQIEISSKSQSIANMQKEFDNQKAELNRQVSDRETELSTSKEKETTLQAEISSKSQSIANMQKELDNQKAELERQVSDLRTELSTCKEKVRGAHNDLHMASQWVTSQVPANCIIPLSAHEDERIKPVFAQLMKRLNTVIKGPDISAVPMSGAEIGREVGCPIVLPCIAASRVGSDANAALSKAKVANAQVILVVFHHLAPHNSRISTPTESRLSDRSIRDKCLAIVDTVFWNGSMYDCQANEIAVNKIQELLMWRISLQKVLELQDIMDKPPTNSS